MGVGAVTTKRDSQTFTLIVLPPGKRRASMNECMTENKGTLSKKNLSHHPRLISACADAQIRFKLSYWFSFSLCRSPTQPP